MNTAPRPRLSVCMIVRNEEQRLPACLASIRTLAAEVVVVDTGSTDRTRTIAEACGAKVIAFPWCADFSRARNAGFEHATGEWILVLDADETLPPASVDAIREIVATPALEACSLVQRSPDAGGGQVASPTVRLVPNRPDVRYENPVHEELFTSLHRAGIPLRDTPIEIAHAGYASSDEVRSKVARNAEILDAMVRASPDVDPQMIYNLGNSLLDRGDLDRAVAEFMRCCDRAGGARPRLAAAARLKAAQAFVRQGKDAQALALLPDRPDPAHHPLALALRAHIEESRPRPEAARRWHEALLAAEDVPYLPHVALAPLKVKALMFLGDLWAGAGREDLGSAVLRIALDIQGRARPDIGSAVFLRYAAIFEQR